jgi:dextranase
MATTQSLSNFSITPEHGFYLPGEPVRLNVCIEAALPLHVNLSVKIDCGLDLVEELHKPWDLVVGTNQCELTWQPGDRVPAGYGIDAAIKQIDGQEAPVACQTAFDVLPNWTAFPRYGFICDFSPIRDDAEQTIETLTRFHLNGLQFYDWQYRHDDLVPPTEVFQAPLGRQQSLKTTTALILSAHQHGMVAMPYLAIYAASAPFWKAHPEWALYDQEHKLIPFGDDFLGIMNPTAGGGWTRHLLEECNKVLSRLPFDGLHIDQYGDPKTGYDQAGRVVDLPAAFADFITEAARRYPQVPILFNAVGNWPIERLAKTPVAFNYIEIWPPETHYTDVAEIVRNARQLSGGKPVVIALYLPASRPINNRLADAMILSAGGTRIEVGEAGRLLADPYFPKHEEMDEHLSETLRRQIELVIRYEKWISPLVEECEPQSLDVPDGVTYFFRKTGEGYSLSLVNLAGLQPLQWNEAHPAPEVQKDFTVSLHLDEPVKRVWLVSPDQDSLTPQALDFNSVAGRWVVKIPRLEIWDVLLFETKQSSI